MLARGMHGEKKGTEGWQHQDKENRDSKAVVTLPETHGLENGNED